MAIGGSRDDAVRRWWLTSVRDCDDIAEYGWQVPGQGTAVKSIGLAAEDDVLVLIYQDLRSHRRDATGRPSSPFRQTCRALTRSNQTESTGILFRSYIIKTTREIL